MAMHRWKCVYRWFVVAILTAPLFASSSCSSRIDAFLDAGRNEDVGDKIDNILDDFGDLFDEIF